MSAEWVRRRYGLDYKRGDRLVVDGRVGTLVSFPEGRLGVRFDGERKVSRCHPVWMVARLGAPGLTYTPGQHAVRLDQIEVTG